MKYTWPYSCYRQLSQTQCEMCNFTFISFKAMNVVDVIRYIVFIISVFHGTTVAHYQMLLYILVFRITGGCALSNISLLNTRFLNGKYIA